MWIDVHASLGFWPFQVFPDVSPSVLERRFASEGVREAWVSPVEAILAPDPAPWNRRLFGRLKRWSCLRPVGGVNPMLANWRETLAECLAQPGLRAVKVFPSYHGYPADDPALGELADRLAAAGRPLLLQVRVDDERNQHPLLRVAGVDPEAILRLALGHPRARVACLGLALGQVCTLLPKAPNLWADLAFAEAFETLRRLLQDVPAERLLFGSHTPHFELRSAELKVALADVPAAVRRQVGAGNARRLAGTPRRARRAQE
jgi:predicted TIM-barrel fold metal-dependent hydrolase